jgi:hypothetical protein
MLSFIHQSALICYIVASIFKPGAGLAASNSAHHPLHLSATEINYNAKENTMELSCRIFTDDFEDALSKSYKVKTDLSAPAGHKAMDGLVKKYMAAHIALAANGKPARLNYLGFEKDNEAVIVYMESEKVENLRNLETTCTVLYDLFDDQTNIFHVTFNGNRKSSKLSYPDRKLTTAF